MGGGAERRWGREGGGGGGRAEEGAFRVEGRRPWEGAGAAERGQGGKMWIMADGKEVVGWRCGLAVRGTGVE